MSNRKHRLVLGYILLATEVIRFVNEVLVLLNMALNYSREEVVYPV